MKKLLVLLGLVASSLFAQNNAPVTANRIVRGNGVPASGFCATAPDVGKVYIRMDAASVQASFYSCDNTGVGTYAWELGGGGSGSITQAYQTIQDETSSLAQRSTLNFAGGGVTCADANPVTTCTIPGTTAGFYSQSFSSATSVVLAHNLNTTTVIVQCFDNSTPKVWIGWNTAALTDANNVTVTFTNAQSGVCYVNSASGGSSNVSKITGTATINFSTSIVDGGCFVGGTTITATGANVGDPVMVGPSTNLASKVESFGKVTASDTVTVEVCNYSGVAVTPGSATWTATLIH